MNWRARNLTLSLLPLVVLVSAFALAQDKPTTSPSSTLSSSTTSSSQQSAPRIPFTAFNKPNFTKAQRADLLGTILENALEGGLDGCPGLTEKTSYLPIGLYKDQKQLMRPAAMIVPAVWGDGAIPNKLFSRAFPMQDAVKATTEGTFGVQFPVAHSVKFTDHGVRYRADCSEKLQADAAAGFAFTVNASTAAGYKKMLAKHALIRIGIYTSNLSTLADATTPWKDRAPVLEQLALFYASDKSASRYYVDSVDVLHVQFGTQESDAVAASANLSFNIGVAQGSTSTDYSTGSSSGLDVNNTYAVGDGWSAADGKIVPTVVFRSLPNPSELVDAFRRRLDPGAEIIGLVTNPTDPRDKRLPLVWSARNEIQVRLRYDDRTPIGHDFCTNGWVVDQAHVFTATGAKGRVVDNECIVTVSLEPTSDRSKMGLQTGTIKLSTVAGYKGTPFFTYSESFTAFVESNHAAYYVDLPTCRNGTCSIQVRLSGPTYIGDPTLNITEVNCNGTSVTPPSPILGTKFTSAQFTAAQLSEQERVGATFWLFRPLISGGVGNCDMKGFLEWYDSSSNAPAAGGGPATATAPVSSSAVQVGAPQTPARVLKDMLPLRDTVVRF